MTGFMLAVVRDEKLIQKLDSKRNDMSKTTGTFAKTLSIIFLAENWITMVALGTKPNNEGGVRVVRRCWVNFQCRGVLQF